jgi:hypothetical protein
MQVKLGFNTDFGRDKFDVGLDEADLARILTDNGIPPDAPVSSAQAFEILRLTGEQLCVRQRARVVPADAEDCKQQYAKFATQLETLLGVIRQKFGLDDAA